MSEFTSISDVFNHHELKQIGTEQIWNLMPSSTFNKFNRVLKWRIRTSYANPQEIILDEIGALGFIVW